MREPSFLTENFPEGLLTPVIFREYDIRGKFGSQLSLFQAEKIGQAFGAWVYQERPELCLAGRPRVCLAHDGRVSSPDLAQALLKGLLSQGVDVFFLGLGPTPFLYWAENNLDVIGGLMVTGSHNPPQDNGIKTTFEKKPFFGPQIQTLYQMMQTTLPPRTPGVMTPKNLLTTYAASLSQGASKRARPLKIIWDCGNGAFGALLRRVTDSLSHTSLILHETVDGTFPERSPDPTKLGALNTLRETIAREKADVGFAFDGDGDRVVMVDDAGTVWAGDELLFFLAENLSKEVGRLKIVADIKSSPFLLKLLEAQGIDTLVEKTGHVHIKKTMQQKNALLGGEVSGHIFFKDEHPGFDDGLYAALRIIRFIEKSSSSLQEQHKKLPTRYTSHELRLACKESEKNLIIEDIKKKLLLKGVPFSSLDGIQVLSDREWWLIRSSQTEASLIVRWEVLDPDAFEPLAERIRELLAPWEISF